mgnify:CR=1 FL=1
MLGDVRACFIRAFTFSLLENNTSVELHICGDTNTFNLDNSL